MKQGNQKSKGNRGERAICKLLMERFPGYEFSRVPSSGAILGQSNKQRHTLMDDTTKEVLSGDIICPPNFRYSIESKFYAEISFWDLFNESSDLHSWMKQVSEDSEYVHKLPLLIVKINNHPHFCATTEEHADYIFKHRGFYFYRLEDFLKKPDCFFFKEGL